MKNFKIKQIKNLESLKKEAAIKSKELNKVVNEIDKIERGAGLPELNKKYLGKYFKTKNSYGHGKGWYIYTIVDSVEFPNSFKGRTFQTTSDGIREFSFEYNGYLSSLEKQIKKEEYMSQLEMVKSFINEKL